MVRQVSRQTFFPAVFLDKTFPLAHVVQLVASGQSLQPVTQLVPHAPAFNKNVALHWVQLVAVASEQSAQLAWVHAVHVDVPAFQ